MGSSFIVISSNLVLIVKCNRFPDGFLRVFLSLKAFGTVSRVIPTAVSRWAENIWLDRLSWSQFYQIYLGVDEFQSQGWTQQFDNLHVSSS